MVTKQLVVVAYDISNNKRRKKVADLLLKSGTRVNYSVFECFITKPQLEKLKQEADALIKKKYDSILYYPLCASCIEKIDRHGNLSKLFVSTLIV
jgi:CRISPR-associated protein Cas2